MIKVSEIPTSVKKGRAYPCILRGRVTGDYYYAIEVNKGINLTQNFLNADPDFNQVDAYDEVSSIMLTKVD